MAKPWVEIVKAKRLARDALIEQHRTAAAVSEVHTCITDIADLDALIKLYETKALTAEVVVRAYIQRACEAHEKTNCLTEINFEDSLQRAKDLDDFQRKHDRLVGPLHGVPISLKDQFNIKGLDSTLGYVGRAHAPASADALLVETLKHLGAVIIAKTNLPQSIMWAETENPLWGLTVHPKNPDFTPGGSSGGEGALLALQGSMIGWGTDIGGSIRVPSHMNGIWGLKPSSARFSYKGVEVSLEGQQHVPSAVGPMARSLSSLTLITKHVIEAALCNHDPQLPPLPWRSDVFETFTNRPLVVGTMLYDGKVKVHPPVERVFNDVVSKLQAAGHEVVEWDTGLNEECIAIMDEYYRADGGEDIRKALSQGGEPVLPNIQAFIDRAPPISVYEYWQLNKKKISAQRAYCEMWNKARSDTGKPVDILLVPTMPHTALPHRLCSRWVGYTKLFNLLDYTALSFPAGKVSKELDPGSVVDLDYTPQNPLDAYNWDHYDLATMDGHDVGLQIVGRRFDEEKVLGVAQQIQKLLKAQFE